MKTPKIDSVLLDKIQSRQALVAILGLRFVGLPEASEVARSGYHVVGIDVDGARIKSLQTAESFIDQIVPKDLRHLISRGCLKFHSDFQPLTKADVVLICVPAPIGEDANLDKRFTNQVSGEIASHKDRRNNIIRL